MSHTGDVPFSSFPNSLPFCKAHKYPIANITQPSPGITDSIYSKFWTPFSLFHPFPLYLVMTFSVWYQKSYFLRGLHCQHHTLYFYLWTFVRGLWRKMASEMGREHQVISVGKSYPPNTSTVLSSLSPGGYNPLHGYRYVQLRRVWFWCCFVWPSHSIHDWGRGGPTYFLGVDNLHGWYFFGTIFK